jgi:uncharacterized protein (DUF1778 family)
VGGSSDDKAERGRSDGEQIRFRLSDEDLELVRTAADSEGVSLDTFAAEGIKRYARDVLADRRLFGVTDEAWNELTAMLDGPPADQPRLRKLLDDDGNPDGPNGPDWPGGPGGPGGERR